MPSRRTTEEPNVYGLEGAILIPILILGSAAILYYGLIGMRERQLARRSGRSEPPAPDRPSTGHD